MAPLSGFRVRAATDSDFEAVADILRADELDGAGRVTLGAEFLRNEWNEAGFDLVTDAWVAVDDEGALLGYGQARRTQPAEVDSLATRLRKSTDPAAIMTGIIIGIALEQRLIAEVAAGRLAPGTRCLLAGDLHMF